MRRFVILSALFIASCATVKVQEDLAQQVNPFIGTDGPGNVYPGATAPFGMVQLSPDNGIAGWDRIAGYFYPDSTIAGFSMTHLSGTGAGDLYDVSFMPTVAPVRVGGGELGIYSSFNHDSEEAYAGYYSVILSDYNLKVELTASERCAVQRYTFPASDSAVVYLNLKKSMNWDALQGAQIEIVNDSTMQGYRFSDGWARNQKLYFVAQFSRSWRSCSVKDSIAKIDFTTTEGEQITVKTAISGTSVAGAWRNFKAEVEGRSFDEVHSATNASWNAHLAKIEIEGGAADDRVNFYTAMYRTMVAPTLFCDVDGAYLGPDGKIHTPMGFKNYSTFSLWDTYRTAHPLLTITNPKAVKDMVASLIAFYDESGALPVWNMWASETDMMIGYHSVPVIVEAYLKGVPMNAERALAACVATADRMEYRGIDQYVKKGYVPSDTNMESVSKTLEYAYDDHCISVMAAKMGRTDIEQRFAARSKAYLNIFKDGFFRPRAADGTFLEPFDAKAYTHHITESNGWQYRFGVQQDVAAMVELLGGKSSFEAALDSMFSLTPLPSDSLPIFSTGMIGQYAHGNEPSHHIAYLYNYIGKAEKASALVTQILKSQYANTPAGLCGNEDCGQMSAWYIMSSLGFYPVDPVSLEYALTTPLFNKATINLEDGKTFVIVKKDKLDVATKYILNGEELKTPFISWADIIAGGTLEFKN